MTRARWILLLLAVLTNVVLLVAFLARFSYAPVPHRRQLANPDRYPLEAAYDVLGRSITRKEAGELLAAEGGARELSAEAGAVPLSERLVQDGREVFYRETFGNEAFLTDVLGILDGGISAWSFARSLLELRGRGTSDLKVRLERDVRVGDQLYREGMIVSTGLDVARGSWLPLGLRFFYDRGRVRAGITCAACHASVEPDSGLVVEGAPNTNLNAGLLLALAANSAAYYLHTSVPSLDPYFDERSSAVRTAEGTFVQLPEPDRFEAAVSGMLAQWPPGSFDATVDRVNNPTSIPDSFTSQDEPFGWSGFAAIGPFRGLAALGNAHALQWDETALAAALPYLADLDPEVHLAILLQRAAHRSYRFDPYGERAPSELLATVAPTPRSPGLLRYAILPSFPRPNYFTLNGLIAVRVGESVGHALNALAAFQDTLRSAPRFALNVEGIERGRLVFERAGCQRCHARPGFTNHAVLAVDQIGSEPSRARALRATADAVVPPMLFAPDTPYPPPADASLVSIPLTPEQRELLRLGWAHGTAGGYKVKGLVGLEWSAPYLHDGGVAVGTDPTQHLGIPGTIGRGVAPDPRASLRALVDRQLRGRVIAANRSSPALVAAHVSGRGHEYWVDAAAGYTAVEQQFLLDFLLSLREVAAK